MHVEKLQHLHFTATYIHKLKKPATFAVQHKVR